MKKLILGMLSLGLAFSTTAQEKKAQDKKSIKDMCGCYEVTFEYAETFSTDKDYQYHDRYRTGGLEWIFVDEESEDKLVLQHLLVVANGQMIIKHWRQDWLYEHTDIYTYHKGYNWKYAALNKKDVEGQWIQKVYQVDDSPRYEASGTWIHEDGKDYWETTTDAPLPRREFTKRKDYNVMRRTNRHEITDFGHIHAQDNGKILRKNGEDKLLVMEKGLNTYRKVENSKCEAARTWWSDHQAYWRAVRDVWQEIFDRKQDMDFYKVTEDQKLWEALFALDQKVAEQKKFNKQKVKVAIRHVIDTFDKTTKEKEEVSL